MKKLTRQSRIDKARKEVENCLLNIRKAQERLLKATRKLNREFCKGRKTEIKHFHIGEK